MEEISDPTIILKILYKSNNKISGKTLSEITGIPLNLIPAKTSKLIARGLVKKESLNGHYSFYWVPKSALKEVRYRLIKKNQMKENDERDN